MFTQWPWIGALAWAWFALLAIAGSCRTLTRPTIGRADDSHRIVTNAALGAVELGLGAILPILAGAAGALADFGLLRLVTVPWFVAVPLAFVLADLIFWLAHRLAHAWPPMWRLHRVHHADTALDVLTTYRHHPGEVAISVGLQSLAILLLGLDPVGVAAYQLAAAFQLPLQHANVAWPVPGWFGAAMRWAFVTPGQHTLHHSAWAAETDSNFGAVLSLWDRLAGTLRTAPELAVRSVRLGLGDRYDAGAGRLPAQLALPLAPV